MKKLIVSLFLIMFACSVGNVSVTKANYDKIKKGMEKAEVIEIMSIPDSKTEVDSGAFGKLELWNYASGMKSISVNFSDGKVISKNWTEF